VELCAQSDEAAGPWCPDRRLEWVPSDRVAVPAVVTLPRVRIVYPDPGAVFVPDPQVPSAVPIEVSSVGSPVEVLVDQQVVGACAASCVLAWPPVPGRHVVQADTQSVTIEVVPSAQEPSSS
jgi:hypothetical protein